MVGLLIHSNACCLRDPRKAVRTSEPDERDPQTACLKPLQHGPILLSGHYMATAGFLQPGLSVLKPPKSKCRLEKRSSNK